MNTKAHIPDGYMENADGALIPVATIKEHRLLEDQLVKDLITRSAPVREAVQAYMSSAGEEVRAFRQLLAEQYGVARGGDKGNTRLSTFDGAFRAELVVAETITYGPELSAAKALIDECLKEWGAGAAPELQAIVASAFRVNKQQEVSRARLAGLRQLNLTDPRWVRAMGLISESERPEKSKEYVRLSRRRPDGGYEHLPLVEY